MSGFRQRAMMGNGGIRLKTTLPVTRYCRQCGLGPREWMECEEPDCDVESQDEANERALAMKDRQP